MKEKTFRTEAAFRRAYGQYLTRCAESHRLPNPAGFCVFSRISRRGFEALGERFPLEYDLCRMAFLDEALNTKCVNSSAVMQFLQTMTGEKESADGDSFRLICEGGLEDGQ